jgi:hypothetical protein
VLRVFPAEFLDVTIDDMLEAARSGNRAAQSARKLLFDARFRK